MTGPGPKEPPFVTHALEAVAHAIGIDTQAAVPTPVVGPVVAPVMDAPAPPPVPASIVATISAALDRAHAAEQAALAKAHAAEKTAADALDHIWGHVENLVQRFPSASDAKAQLEAAFRNFAAAIAA